MAAQKGSACINVCLFLAIVTALALAVALAVVVLGQTEDLSSGKDSQTPSRPSGPSESSEYKSAYGEFRFASVAADNPICSTIGTDMLARGGGAVDATVATMFCIGIVHCHSTGIGGGNFMTIFDKPKAGGAREMKIVMSREVAPQAATDDMFINKTGSPSTLGGLAIAVPGELKGYYTAWERYGRLPWKDLVMPAVKLAKDGFPVGPHLALAIQETIEEFDDPELDRFPSLKAMLTEEGAHPLPKEGDMLKLPKLAATLETISDEGASAFYDGSLTQNIVDDIQDHGGIITLADLNSYKAVMKDPGMSTLSNGNFKVYGPPPPSSGTVIQYILNILDGYNFDKSSIGTVGKEIETYHRVIEAFKWAYGKRSALGDADVVDVTAIVANLTSGAFGDETRAKIQDDSTQTLDDYEPAFDKADDHGTSHLSLLAADGSAVGQTSTINLHFGSKSVGSRTGIIFNNEMDDFSTPGVINAFGIPSSSSNYIAPGKRPMSSMSPTIILDSDDNVRFIAGASQGTRIITSTTWSIIRTLWFGLRLDTAVNLPRFHHQLLPATISYPPERWDKAIVDGLKAKNHKFEERAEKYWYGVVQAINNACKQCEDDDSVCLSKCIGAVSDFRKGGKPDGY